MFVSHYEDKQGEVKNMQIKQTPALNFKWKEMCTIL